MKKIVIMEQFYSQVNDLNLSKKAFESIKREINLLTKFNTNIDLFSYLKNQNAKKLQGHVHQFKYRMNRGDRIFFTYGKYVENVPSQYKDAILIYGYSRHEDQDEEEIPDFEDGYVYVPSEIEDVKETEEQYIPDFATEQSERTLDTSSSFYLKSHSFFAFDENNIPEDINNLDVMLSSEQERIIDEYTDSPCPTLILGGAGTGKTVMGIHILNDFSILYEDSKCAYFTQSYPLLRKSSEKFKFILGNDKDRNIDNISFENLIQFCISRINKASYKKIKPENFVEKNRFSEFIKSSRLEAILNKNKIQEYDLWAEIRGTIKGGLDKNWARYNSFNQSEFSGVFINKLERQNLLIRNKGDSRYFRIKSLEEYKERKVDFLNNDVNDKYKYIFNTISNVNPSSILLPYEDYEQVSEENSTLDYEQRKIAYSIAEKYQLWLEQNNLYDDNDLILENLKMPVTEEEKFEFIIIDEIQDYTELQIYFITRLLNNLNHLVMAGDEHQIVNPTIFSEERLKRFFYSSEKGLHIKINRLQRNFRCPDEIVKISNSLTSMAKKYIGSKGENPLIETLYSTDVPMMIKWSPDNYLSLIDELLNYPDVIVIVPDNYYRNKIIQEFGENKYKAANNPIISTVSEIKGMEYKFVVLLNLVGHNENRWIEIFDGKARHATCYRYCSA